MYKVLLLQSPDVQQMFIPVPTRCRLTIVSDLKSPATSCITINVLKNSLCHIWVCITVRAIEMCGVSLKWIRMKTTLGQTSSYNFQVRAEVHRTISPSVFTHLRLCQESPRASDLNSLFLSPKKTELLPHLFRMKDEHQQQHLPSELIVLGFTILSWMAALRDIQN